MSFRYFPHAILFIGAFVFLIKGIMVYLEKEFRIPFTQQKYIRDRKAQFVAFVYFIIAIICAWDFIYILVNTGVSPIP